jgi:hypothetical protein
MEVALSQRQLDALYRLLVPRGVDPDDERTLLKLAVSMSTQLDQNRRGAASIVQTANRSNFSAELARNMASKSFTQHLLASSLDVTPTKLVVPRLEVLMAFHSDSDSNDQFFLHCLKNLKLTKLAEIHAAELSADESSVVNSVFIAAVNVSASSLSTAVKSSWSEFMLDVLGVNIPSCRRCTFSRREIFCRFFQFPPAFLSCGHPYEVGGFVLDFSFM